MQQIHHKKNEIQEVEFYKDEECTEAFDFTNAKNLYIDGLKGDISPITAINDDVRHYANIYTPYIPANQKPLPQNVLTLDDITPNLSKYIPEDNAVLFLNEEGCNKYSDYFKNIRSLYVSTGCYNSFEIFDKYKKCILTNNTWLKLNKKLTIFLPYGTKAELQKAEEVGKHLWKNFGRKLNLCVLHWFGSKYEVNAFEIEYLCEDFGVLSNINKIITTNSTGILKPEDSSERLQIIDAKEIFEEYLNGNNLIRLSTNK